VTLLRGRALLVILAGLIALVLVLWIANGAWAAFLDQLRGDDGALLASLGDTVERIASTAATIAALALLGLAPIVALLGVLRALARRRRRYARLAIVPSQNEATPERVQELATAIHQRVEERWYRRDPRIAWIDITTDAVTEAASTVIAAVRAAGARTRSGGAKT